MIVKCVIIGNKYGAADFGCVRVRCSDEDYQSGLHFDLASEWASEQGYDEQRVIWDEHEAPDWLLERFVWDDTRMLVLTPPQENVPCCFTSKCGSRGRTVVT